MRSRGVTSYFSITALRRFYVPGRLAGMGETKTRTKAFAVAGICVVLAGAAVVVPGSPVREVVSVARNHFECFTPDHEGGVMALGDSITAGHAYRPLNMGADDSYFDVLGCSGAVEYAGNAGVWQDTTAQMLDRLDADVISESPSKVFVLGGTNDVINGDTSGSVENLAEIRNQLTAAGIESVFGLIPPSEDYPQETQAFNEEVKAWAEAENVPLIDYWTPLAAEDGTYRDGLHADAIHPSAEGAALMAEAATTR